MANDTVARTAETFAVGEIAIYVRPGSPFFGVEVTVTGSLEMRRVIDARDLSRRYERAYRIDGPFDSVEKTAKYWCTPPEYLRKRRPPQDWVKICELESAPVEDRIEEFA